MAVFQSRRRLLATAALVVGWMLQVDTAHADPRDNCLEAHIEGQKLEHAGQLRSASRIYATCTSPTCPAAIRKDCDEWRQRTQRATPTIVVRTTDEAGRDLQATLSVDDVPVELALGRAIELDPGPHRVDVSAPGRTPTSVSVVAVAGEKDRILPVVLSAPVPAPLPLSADRPSVLHWAPLTLAGVGAVGVTLFAVVGLGARADDRALAGSCAPACNPSRADDLRERYLVADVSLAVGAAFLVGAGIWLAVRATQRGPHPASHVSHAGR